MTLPDVAKRRASHPLSRPRYISEEIETALRCLRCGLAYGPHPILLAPFRTVGGAPGKVLSEHGLPIAAYDTVVNDAGND